MVRPAVCRIASRGFRALGTSANKYPVKVRDDLRRLKDLYDREHSKNDAASLGIPISVGRDTDSTDAPRGRTSLPLISALPVDGEPQAPQSRGKGAEKGRRNVPARQETKQRRRRASKINANGKRRPPDDFEIERVRPSRPGLSLSATEITTPSQLCGSLGESTCVEPVFLPSPPPDVAKTGFPSCTSKLKTQNEKNWRHGPGATSMEAVDRRVRIQKFVKTRTKGSRSSLTRQARKST